MTAESRHQASGIAEMLASLVTLIEHQTPSMRCSILLLDGDGVTLRHGAAPRLPEHYCRAIDGLRIGPKVGSCGTAAFHRRLTVVSDIATDELWADFRALALPIGLRACWSTPILASTGDCLGTFAMYYDEPREPLPADIEVITTAGALAAAVIERDRLHAGTLAAHDELEAANEQLQETGAELEMLNQQLQENAVELEMQADALEAANIDLRMSEEKLRRIFECAPVALAVLDGPEHRYSIVSPRYSDYVRGAVIVGKTAAEAFPEQSADAAAVLDRVFQTGEPAYHTEHRVALDRDGDGIAEEYYFNVGYNPLRDAEGKVYAIVSASLDVTSQVQARRDLELARAEAERANRAKSDFLATMSHELRTPLNAIAGYADLLLAGVRGELQPEQRGDVERMRRSGQHLLGLINDILNFAKLEAGSVEFHLADTRVANVLQSLEELMRPQIDSKPLGFSQAMPDEEIVVRADEEKVRQVLLNLVTNAVKFTEAGGCVAVECDADASNVRIIVRDTGRGIPSDHLDRIFDPFVQVDRERTPRSQQGVGLGLSISRDLAKGMGGSLSVTSALGEGTAFTLTLPRTNIEAAPVAVETRDSSQSTNAATFS